MKQDKLTEETAVKGYTAQKNAGFQIGDFQNQSVPESCFYL